MDHPQIRTERLPGDCRWAHQRQAGTGTVGSVTPTRITWQRRW